MKTLPEDERTKKALSRFEVIAPLLRKALPRGAQKELIQELSSQLFVNEHNQLIRYGRRTKVY